MSLDNASKIARLRGMTAKFTNAVENAIPIYPRFCTTVPSTGSDEQYGMLGSFPGMREWIGDRQMAKLAASDYLLKNKTWENSVKIEKEHIEDDRMGMYDATLAELGNEAAYHPDELLFEVMEAGASSACMDGQYFFDTDHVWNESGTQSNKLVHDVTSPAAVTEAEFRAAYSKMVNALIGFKKDNGKPYHRPTIGPMTGLTLTVPLALRDIAAQALTKPLINGGETNVVLDAPEILTCTYFTSNVKMRLFRTGQVLNPFVFQARRPLQRQMKGLDDREFKDVKFMCDARYNLGFGAWWSAVELEFT